MIEVGKPRGLGEKRGMEWQVLHYTRRATESRNLPCCGCDSAYLMSVVPHQFLAKDPDCLPEDLLLEKRARGGTGLRPHSNLFASLRLR